VEASRKQICEEKLGRWGTRKKLQLTASSTGRSTKNPNKLHERIRTKILEPREKDEYYVIFQEEVKETVVGRAD